MWLKAVHLENQDFYHLKEVLNSKNLFDFVIYINFSLWGYVVRINISACLNRDIEIKN